ncbi:MAG: penicillin-binding protein 2 [Proteobacteria bacterium]|nr:penicillin-binding protein 2 [Pseudomonadota bacterium]
MAKRNTKPKALKPIAFGFRRFFVVAVFLAVMGTLAGRAVYLQVINAEFLVAQGNARHLRVVKQNAVRGMIVDRNGAPLAISTPVDSVWVHPAHFSEASDRWLELAKTLGMRREQIASQVVRNKGREFMYLRRHVTPDVASKIKSLKIPGVALLREYRRYYPTGAVTGHVLGFTNIDDQGQEGIELMFEKELAARPGKKQVFKDRYGNIVESVEQLQPAIAGKDVRITLDRRLQYLLYRELTGAVKYHKARAASAVMMDVQTGEILAMVNAPDFNPNNRSNFKGRLFRNRAVTDVFEPGSTLKPFTVAAALEGGLYTPASRINTAPGVIKVGSKLIHDTHNHGMLTVAGALQKSSNVGLTKIALSMTREAMWENFNAMGFGKPSGVSLPGEAAGTLLNAKRWMKMDQAAMSFGYGISVNALQLARAYTAIANDGVLAPAHIVPVKEAVAQRVFSKQTARQVRDMLEMAAGGEGTGAAAQVQHYRIAGKTGTVHKLVNGKYAEDRYLSLFAGMAPAADPRIVMVVMIDDPKGKYFGGQVAAPVFGSVMAGAMRILNITPDAPVLNRQWANANTGGAT